MKKILKTFLDNKLLFIFSILESFLQIYGSILSSNGGLKDIGLLMIIFIIIFTIIIFSINLVYFKLLSIKYKNNDKYVFSKKKFLILWLLIFVMWIPVLLSYYPTIWAYDVYNQVPHLIGDKLSTHHPIFHTLFIELFLIIGKSIKNYEFGMLLLSLVQMLVTSCIFAFVIEKIKSNINNKLFRNIFFICMIIFYGLLPFNSIMSISMTKDVLFSSLLLLLVIYIYDLIDGKPSNSIMFIFISALLLLIKNNSIFIYLVMLMFSIFILKRVEWVMFAKRCLISIMVFYIILDGLILIFKPSRGNKLERYPVELQNLNYVLINHPEVQKDKELLFDILPKKSLKYDVEFYYDKRNADIVKTIYEKSVGNEFDSKVLIKNWIHYGIKYPVDYIDSWSNLTIGSWYLFDESHANIYYGDNQGYLLTDYKIIDGISNKRPDSKFKFGFDLLEKVATENVQYKYQIIRFIFEPATYIISFFLMFIYLISKHKKRELLPLILFVALYINILFGPVIILRYIYPFIIFVPVLFTRIIYLNNIKRED